MSPLPCLIYTQFHSYFRVTLIHAKERQRESAREDSSLFFSYSFIPHTFSAKNCRYKGEQTPSPASGKLHCWLEFERTQEISVPQDISVLQTIKNKKNSKVKIFIVFPLYPLLQSVCLLVCLFSSSALDLVMSIYWMGK